MKKWIKFGLTVSTSSTPHLLPTPYHHHHHPPKITGINFFIIIIIISTIICFWLIGSLTALFSGRISPVQARIGYHLNF